ncbi:hypothetical protein FACS1894105_12130 [Clostridia bacterium]|nr:hypothetical protein FACS1894105_12130 [Clostridia bacterium]
MTAHELMIKTNHHLIKGGTLTGSQKSNIVNQLLAARSDERTKQSFYKGVKYPGNVDKDGGGHMYPIYFIPPYNGNKKYQTVIPMSPKTHILSANSYELEIIRLLHLFAPEDTVIGDMVTKSLARLKTTCYGYHDCAIGECFHSALIVLRFLAAVAPGETEWIAQLLRFFNRHLEEKLAMRGKGIHGNVLWYYWLCLSELPFELAAPEIDKYKPQMLLWLTEKSCVMNSEHDKTIHPVMLCILRNCLCRFPEYAHIKDIQPYVSESDGRLRFDMKGEKLL